MFVVWNPNPTACTVADTPVSWYGVLFALGFLLSQRFMIHVYKVESKPPHETLLLYLIVGTAIGARLGHCLFYDPRTYLSHPLEILKIWEGGLASHGAAAGILVSLFLFARRHPEQGYLWLVDRIMICATMVGVLVRIGNFVNSEIPGTPTGCRYGVVFAHDLAQRISTVDGVRGSVTITPGQPPLPAPPGTVLVEAEFDAPPRDRGEALRLTLDAIPQALKSDPLAAAQLSSATILLPAPRLEGYPGFTRVSMPLLALARHPVQLYEAAFYLLLFLALLLTWHRKRDTIPHGRLLGLSLIVLFLFRFIVEFFKEDVEVLHAGIRLTMGQVLSLPFIIAGLGILLVVRHRSDPATAAPRRRRTVTGAGGNGA